MTILAIVFWLSVLLIFHTYLLFPWILYFLERGRKPAWQAWTLADELPRLSILMSLYNEEAVIMEKIRNIYRSGYPLDRIEVLAGSDASDDGTEVILQQLCTEYPSLRLFRFQHRQGKANVLRMIIPEAKGDILVFTDAQVFFGEDSLFHLVKYFRDPDVAVAGARLVNSNLSTTGIAYQENTFINQEMKIKYREGALWGTMMGAYGACFAIRKEDMAEIPEGHPAEDFFISVYPLLRKRKAILSWEAVCQENVPGGLTTEYRRRVRISSGNVTNMLLFSRLLWPPHRPEAFCFLSHKVLRWMGPLFLILALLANIFLARIPFYRVTLYLQLIIMIIPFIDLLLRKFHLHIVILRFVTHFYWMNIALVTGFIKHLKGEKSNVWQPTRRVQG